MSQSQTHISLLSRIAGWSIHIFTASGAVLGLFALFAIFHHDYLQSFWLMGAAILIDAVDGVLARGLKVKTVVPQINGELLDNIVDFFTYTVVPCFFLLVSSLLPGYAGYVSVVAIILASAYQFTQVDAKTSDHFFKGFPSYWNIVVFYLFFWQTSPWVNFAILMLLVFLTFVPIKYVYPSRPDYLTHSKMLRVGLVLATAIWGAATAGLLWVYPASNLFLSSLSMGYLVLYVAISLYRTWMPLDAK